MAVSNETNRIKHTGDASTVLFTFDFAVIQASDLLVYTIVRSTGVGTLKTLTTDYTVSLNESAEGGSITMLSAPASTLDVLIINVPGLGSEYDLSLLNNISTYDLQAEINRLHIQNIMLAERIGRALKFPVTSSSEGAELPEPSTGKTLKWTAEGVFENSDYDPDEQAILAAASAAAAAASELAAAASETAADASETAAAASASAAAASETAAATSETNAAASETAAAASETAAAASETAAATSETNAAASETAAAASETAAATSETNAAASETAAAASETAAATSETNAAASEAAAALSESNAAAYAASAATLLWAGTVGGTGDAITLTTSPALGSYSNGIRVAFKATNTNTGAVTVNVSGLGNKDLKTQSGAALVAGNITTGRVYTLVYDGTNFQTLELATPEEGSVSRPKLATGAVAKVTVTSSKTSTYSATTSDDVIRCDASGGAFTVNLPAASGNSGAVLEIIKTDSSANAITVDGNSSETINGATTTTLNTQYEKLKIVCDGSNWLILERRTAFSATEAWTDSESNCSTSVSLTRNGQWLEVEGITTASGAFSLTQLTVTVPAAYAFDPAVYPSPSTKVHPLGQSAFVNNGNSTYFEGKVHTVSSSAVFLSASAASGSYGAQANTSSNIPFTWASGDKIMWNARWRVTGWNG